MTPTDRPAEAHEDVTFARRVLVVVAVLYPLWGLFCFWQLAGHQEPFGWRLAIAGLCLALWGASFASRAVAERLPAFLLPAFVLLTAHYFGIVLLNQLGAVYLVGVFITVSAIDALLRSSRALLIYTALLVPGSAVLAAFAPGQSTLVALLIFGLATLQLGFWLAVTAQERSAGKLAAAYAELERTNANLKAADRYKDDFLAIISHELRTPLNAIIGFGSILEDGLAGDLNPTQRRDVRRIGESADSLLALVNDLLDMSRIQAGKFALEPEPMALRAVVDDVVAGLAPIAARAGQTLKVEVPATLPLIAADPQRVRQVLTNLVGNAIKFNRAAGVVRLRARLERTVLRLEVSDEGAGIHPDDQARLFHPFTQVDTSRTRRAGGTGLGLSICKALVEAHGGHIGVVSDGAHGSTFWFTLPLRGGEPG